MVKTDIRRRASAWLRRERGDVPGWVMVTIMTAGLVAILWPLAQDLLQQMLQGALNLVSP
ncbi:hypothetical protein G1H11_12215 [Phytoactinopolyspora alkaliphila]|uniref:Uncharacterized protein n=1 Tax=Phytoactinopolyspora alkaliphila TaxID=1783498 RepID=A0A6N9YM48_9ACTN|nr:hypothetical protein [Phytoactinopolyspora alkaliphila]NED96073.1 hypothetical protein [Phytoactinopolyspora alkaliphila]